MPVVLAHIPAGTSTKTVIHYTQEIEDYGNFQCFDYGKEGNLKEYGTETPPLYNLTNIEVPTYLMYADNDLMVNPIVSTTGKLLLSKFIALRLNKFSPIYYLSILRNIM